MADPDRFGHLRLEIYKLAHSLSVRIHSMTLRLPAFETFEEGSQIRRSSKSVSALIVEGYGLRKYRDEFLHYLHRAVASADETREHLAYLYDTGSLKDAAQYSGLASDCEKLAAKIGRFIVGVERDHSKPFYLRSDANAPGSTLAVQESRIENLESFSSDSRFLILDSRILNENRTSNPKGLPEQSWRPRDHLGDQTKCTR